MKDDLIKLREMFENIDAEVRKFRKAHSDEFYGLCDRYISVKGDYIQRGLGPITDMYSNTVEVQHYGWEGDYTTEFPIQLFIDPDFIIELEEAKEIKMNKSKLADEERSRQEYLRLKKRFEE
jgi:hypothetical protein